MLYFSWCFSEQSSEQRLCNTTSVQHEWSYATWHLLVSGRPHHANRRCKSRSYRGFVSQIGSAEQKAADVEVIRSRLLLLIVDELYLLVRWSHAVITSGVHDLLYILCMCENEKKVNIVHTNSHTKSLPFL